MSKGPFSQNDILDIRRQINDMLDEDIEGNRLVMVPSPPIIDPPPLPEEKTEEAPVTLRPRANPMITLENNPNARITKEDIYAAIISTQCLRLQNESLKEFIDDDAAKKAIDLAQNTIEQLEILWIDFYDSIFPGGKVDRSLLVDKA
jgi:hypothetical protein